MLRNYTCHENLTNSKNKWPKHSTDFMYTEQTSCGSLSFVVIAMNDVPDNSDERTETDLLHLFNSFRKQCNDERCIFP
jgi:hypothetical protein